MIPLYGFVEGDTLGVVLLARNDQQIWDLALSLVSAASVRVAPRGRLVVFARGRRLEDGITVAQAGLAALDRFDVRLEAGEGQG